MVGFTRWNWQTIAAACAVGWLLTPAAQGITVKSSIAPAGMTYDAVSSYPGMPNIPSMAGCALPGFGVCGDQATYCPLPPSSGYVHDHPYCPLDTPDCFEVAGGPNGIDSADVPAGRLASGLCKGSIGKSSQTLTCKVQGVVAANQNLRSTDPSGFCDGGPKDGTACTSNRTCGNGYFCLTPRRCKETTGQAWSGAPCTSDADCGDTFGACGYNDEYYCEMNMVLGSNADNSPPCGPCLMAVVPGDKGAGCGLAGSAATCTVGTCSAGGRAGEACSKNSDCDFDSSGATCSLLGQVLVLTGDETGRYSPVDGGMAYALCPTLVRNDLPLEIKDGKGTTTARANDLSLCFPAGITIQPQGCFVHEPGTASAFDEVTQIGFFTGNNPTYGSQFGLPCPTTLPYRRSDADRSFRTGVGPIIGVSGSVSK